MEDAAWVTNGDTRNPEDLLTGELKDQVTK